MPTIEQIDILKEVFVEWLRMYDADYDFAIYTQDEWTKREGPNHFFMDAELIVTFGNSLYNWLNSPGQYDKADELTDLAAGFGYWYEQGHSWNLGFIKFEDWPPLPPADASYAEKLADIRWKDIRPRGHDQASALATVNLATQQRETGRHPIVGVSAIGRQDFADLPEQFFSNNRLVLCRVADTFVNDSANIFLITK